MPCKLTVAGQYWSLVLNWSLGHCLHSHPPFLSSALIICVASQALIGTDSITNLHKLEQVSSDEGIGTLAENLLEALREHPDVNKKIDAARKETRAEKKRMAMAMRQKALGTLGMTVGE